MSTTTIALTEIAKNPPVAFSPLQLWMASHIYGFEIGWLALWCTMLTLALYRVYRLYRVSREA